jgi:replicative DNA helicase Mcm
MNQEKMQYVKESIQHQSSFIQDFVNDYLAREMHLGWGMERPNYLMTYNLDLRKIREYSESDRFHELTDEEVAKFHLNPDQMKKLFEDSQREHRENRWFDDCQHLLELLDQDYEETMKLMNEYLVYQVVSESDRDYPDFIEPKWNVINEERYSVKFGDLNLSDFEGKTVVLTGYLSYVQNPAVERIKEAVWMCTYCKMEIESLEKPEKCPECERTRFSLYEEKVVKERMQEAILTEEYEANPSGFQLNLSLLLLSENVGKYAPGDHVSVTGKVLGVFVKERGKTPFYKYVIETSSIRKDELVVSLTSEDIREIEKFASESNILERMASKVAPGIIGHVSEKKAMVLQAAGCEDMTGGKIRRRGRIHILFVGDPGTGKSQLLMAAKSLSPKTVYVTDASAAGLTAAVDEVNGKRVMVAGVMVLADNGIAAIDELDKMRKADREGIHPAMESGEIKKSKAGLHASFKSRASVIAAANPKYGKFDVGEPIADQVSIEIPLLNRFDLIFILIDKNGSEAYEIEKAKKILSYNSTSAKSDFLTKYISVASQIHPQLTEEVSTLIAHYYSDVRKKKGESTINPRTLESIKRLTLASARVRMHELTDKEDFENARELIDMYLKQFGYDLDAISGITKSVRDSMIWIQNLIGIHGTIGKEEIFAAAKNDNVNERNIERAIDAMYRSGLIFEAGPGRYGVL